MIDPETSLTATAMLQTFLEAEHHGALPQQLPALVPLLARGLLVCEMDLFAGSVADELSTV